LTFFNVTGRTAPVSATVWVGVLAQIGLILILLSAIQTRLSRRPTVAAAA